MFCAGNFSELLGADLLGVELPDADVGDLQQATLSTLDESQVGGDLESVWAESLSWLLDADLPDDEDLQKSPSSTPGESRAGEECELFWTEGLSELPDVELADDTLLEAEDLQESTLSIKVENRTGGDFERDEELP